MKKAERLSIQEMTQYRERLSRQKEFLIDILSQIDKQIMALQVERLHLRNTLLGSEPTSTEVLPDVSVKNECTTTEQVTDNRDLTNLNTQQLDLSMPLVQNDFEEEIEDEEITDNEKELFDKFLC